MYGIGNWTFDASTGELTRGDVRRRLEPRAALALKMLVEARGALVRQEQLVGEIWQGRTLSDNSVAVVISQLRRALDDNARDPELIETVPKRGYRLKPGTIGSTERVRPLAGRRPLLAGIALIVALTAGLWTIRIAAEPVVQVVEVANRTGRPAYDPLARATSELILAELNERGLAVRRTGPGDVRLEARLVWWDGGPSLGLTATEASGDVRWSAMMDAGAGRVPEGLERELDRFAAEVRR